MPRLLASSPPSPANCADHFPCIVLCQLHCNPVARIAEFTSAGGTLLWTSLAWMEPAAAGGSRLEFRPSCTWRHCFLPFFSYSRVQHLRRPPIGGGGLIFAPERARASPERAAAASVVAMVARVDLLLCCSAEARTTRDTALGAAWLLEAAGMRPAASCAGLPTLTEAQRAAMAARRVGGEARGWSGRSVNGVGRRRRADWPLRRVLALRMAFSFAGKGLTEQ